MKEMACVALFFSCALIGMAQEQKPGLYEVTLVSCFTAPGVPCPSVPALPASTNPKPGAARLLMGVPIVRHACVTPEMIANRKSKPSPAESLAQMENRFGIQRQCTTTVPVKEGNRSTFSTSCSLTFPAVGKTPATHFTTSGTTVVTVDAHGDVHSISEGKLVSGSTSTPMLQRTEMSRVYQGPDCGDVKPVLK